MSLEGRLEDLGLSDIFQIISLSKRSGVLTLIRKEGTARLVFRHGQVVFASSDSTSRLGFTLVRKGIISNEDLEFALRMQKGRGPPPHRQYRWTLVHPRRHRRPPLRLRRSRARLEPRRRLRSPLQHHAP